MNRVLESVRPQLTKRTRTGPSSKRLGYGREDPGYTAFNRAIKHHLALHLVTETKRMNEKKDVSNQDRKLLISENLADTFTALHGETFWGDANAHHLRGLSDVNNPSRLQWPNDRDAIKRHLMVLLHAKIENQAKNGGQRHKTVSDRRPSKTQRRVGKNRKRRMVTVGEGRLPAHLLNTLHQVSEPSGTPNSDAAASWDGQPNPAVVPRPTLPRKSKSAANRAPMAVMEVDDLCVIDLEESDDGQDGIGMDSAPGPSSRPAAARPSPRPAPEFAVDSARETATVEAVPEDASQSASLPSPRPSPQRTLIYTVELPDESVAAEPVVNFPQPSRRQSACAQTPPRFPALPVAPEPVVGNPPSIQATSPESAVQHSPKTKAAVPKPVAECLPNHEAVAAESQHMTNAPAPITSAGISRTYKVIDGISGRTIFWTPDLSIENMDLATLEMNLLRKLGGQNPDDVAEIQFRLVGPAKFDVSGPVARGNEKGFLEMKEILREEASEHALKHGITGKFRLTMELFFKSGDIPNPPSYTDLSLKFV